MILVLGLLCVAAATLLIAEQVRVRDLDRLRRAGMVDTVAGAIVQLRDQPEATAQLIDDGHYPGMRFAVGSLPDGSPQAEASRLLAARIGAAASVTHVRAPACVAPDQAGARLEDCWFVRFRDRGVSRLLVADIPLIRVYRSPFVEPSYILLLAAIGIALAVVVTRATIIPLRRLTQAADRFSISLDPVPVAERGPRELRTAFATFNLMQRRVRDGMRERTHILAAVSHDLQTPLTRMRLRLEEVSDDTLRERLLADLMAMQRLVGEGLDLAQSTESREPFSSVDLDSVLSSLAEDRADGGEPVTFVGGCQARVRVRLAALSRTLQNLVDNAVKYGGSAELSCRSSADGVAIEVRDRGAGIAEQDLEAAFEPFTRLASDRADGRGGTGIGLTIARAQAATFGGAIILVNDPGGGLIATVSIPA